MLNQLKNLNQIVLELEHTYSFQKIEITWKTKESKENTIHWLLSREALTMSPKISRLDTLAKEATIFMVFRTPKTVPVAYFYL